MEVGGKGGWVGCLGVCMDGASDEYCGDVRSWHELALE